MAPEVFILGKSISSYLLFNFILAGIIVPFSIMGYILLKENVNMQKILTILTVQALLVVFWGRLVHYIIYYKSYIATGTSIFKLGTFGIIMVAGVMLTLPLMMPITRLLGVPSSKLMTAVGIGAPLVIAVSKIGCFLTGCCGGIPTNLPWGVNMPGISVPLHPVQLYETGVMFLVGVFLIYKYIKATYDYEGQSAVLFLKYFMLMRFFIFFIRSIPEGAESMALLAPIIFAVSFVVTIILDNKFKKRMATTDGAVEIEVQVQKSSDFICYSK